MKKIILEITEKIKKNYKPCKVILYGSYIYGKPDKDSDIDLLIIKETNKSPIDRWIELKKILRDITKKVPVSPLVYTPKEVKERLAIKDFFIKEILEKGKVLYE